MREAEDVVDEEQHVLALVAEVLGHRQARQRHAGAGARGLVHLAVDEGAFRTGRGAAVLVRVHVDLGLDHLVVKVVALAGALAHAGEDRVAAVRLGDVVDEFHDQHGLADASAAEQADLAALGVGRQEVDDLDAGLEDLRLGGLLGVGRRRLVDGAGAVRVDRAGLVDRLADDVHDAAERTLAHRHQDRLAGVGHGLAAGQAFGDVHGDAAHGVLAEMLGHFEDEAVAVVGSFQRVQDLGQVALELHVHHGADDLGDLAGGAVRRGVEAVAGAVSGEIVHGVLT